MGDKSEFIAIGLEGNFRNESSVLYLGRDGGYTVICQNSSNCTLRCESILLHIYYISIKLVKHLIKNTCSTTHRLKLKWSEQEEWDHVWHLCGGHIFVRSSTVCG